MEFAEYNFCSCTTGDLDFGLEKMEFITHAGRNCQHTLCPILTLTIASVEEKMLM